MGTNQETNDTASLKSDLQITANRAETSLNPELVQITANRTEIKRRIEAFMEKKRQDVDRLNARDFCNRITESTTDSCARADAVYVSFYGHKSHIKVRRVENAYGPQTLSLEGKRSSSDPTSSLEQRLQTLEQHLSTDNDVVDMKDVYKRLKKLEERVLELEGISPEYIQLVQKQHKVGDGSHVQRTQPCSKPGTSTDSYNKPATNRAAAKALEDVENEIQLLKEQLLQHRQQ